MKAGNSIISNDKECIICFSRTNINKHHIFYGGGNRKLSEKEGCWCYLCANHHNMAPHGVHYDDNLDTLIKRQCQTAWERQNGGREKFIEKFGKSYL